MKSRSTSVKNANSSMNEGFWNPGKRYLLTRLLPAWMLLQAACLFLASRSYPSYSLFEHDISFLGHPQLNANGWWFWSLGMGLTGILWWPMTIWASRQMNELTVQQSPWRKRFVTWGSASLRGSCLGLIGLALIPQSDALDAAHIAAGAIAFCGLFATMCIFWCIPLWSTSLSRAKILLFTLAAYWGPVGYLATQGYRFVAYGEIGRVIRVKDQSLWLRFSLWEWMLLFGSTIAALTLVLLLPTGRAAEV